MAHKELPLVIWEVDVRFRNADGERRLFVTNYLARTKAQAENMAVRNANRPGAGAILAHAKRSQNLERVQQQLYGPGGQRPQGPRRRAVGNRKGR
jgi:hypothetical protein